MKTVIRATVAAVGVLLAAPAFADIGITGRYLEQGLVEVCSNAQLDDVARLNKTLRDYHISQKTAVRKVMCNQQWLVGFARSHQAYRVVAELERYEVPTQRKVTITDISAPAN